MKKSILLSSILAGTLLFTACGGDGDKKDPAPIVGDKPTFTSPSSYTVVAGEKKSITLTTGENVIGAGEPLYDFEIVDKGDAIIAKVNEIGVLLYTAPAAGTTQTIKVTATKDNATSDPYEITFTSVAKDSVTATKPLKTGAADGGFGLDRNFTKNGVVVVDPRGKEWADGVFTANASSTGVSFGDAGATYKTASDSCTGKGGNWRLPTIDELYDNIDFSKVSQSPMVDEAFTVNLLTSWAQEAYGKRVYMGNNYGSINYPAEDDIKIQVRCVNAPQQNANNHVVYTNDYGFTYDLSSALEWSPASADLLPIAGDGSTSTAAEYCETLNTTAINELNELGWRVPNINELRSVIEDGTISNFITKGAREFASSTPYNDFNTTAQAANWGIILRENGTVLIGAGYQDTPKRVICVRDLD